MKVAMMVLNHEKMTTPLIDITTQHKNPDKDSRWKSEQPPYNTYLSRNIFMCFHNPKHFDQKAFFIIKKKCFEKNFDILHLYFLCYDTIEDSCDLSSYTEIATPIYIQSYLSDIFCGKTCNTFKKPTHKNYDEPPEVIFFQILWNL